VGGLVGMPGANASLSGCLRRLLMDKGFKGPGRTARQALTSHVSAGLIAESSYEPRTTANIEEARSFEFGFSPGERLRAVSLCP